MNQGGMFLAHVSPRSFHIVLLDTLSVQTYNRYELSWGNDLTLQSIFHGNVTLLLPPVGTNLIKKSHLKEKRLFSARTVHTSAS